MFSFDKNLYKGICIPYARFSTKSQSKVGKKSLERQLGEARRYADQNNLFINEELIFADKGVSGRSLSGNLAKAFKKGQMQVMLAMLDDVPAEERQFVFITFHNFDRFSRMSPDDAQAYFNLILQKGFNIITTIDNQLYTRNNKSLSSMIISIIKMTTAWQESEVKSIYVKDALARKKEIVDYLYNHPSQKGKHKHIGVVQPSIPRWIKQENITYEYVDQNGLKKVDTFKRFTLHEQKAKIVQYIFEMRLSGLGHTRISQRLNEEGIPVFDQGKFKEAKHWHGYAIQNILVNEKVLGHLVLKSYKEEEFLCEESKTFKKRKVPVDSTGKLHNYYPAAVTEDMFIRANNVQLNKKSKPKPIGRIGERTNIFARIMVCSCGGSLQYHRTVKKFKNHERIKEYLRCLNAQFKNKCNCSGINYTELEESFFRFVNHLDFRSICAIGAGSVDNKIQSIEMQISESETVFNKLKLTKQGLERTFNSAIEKGMDATFVLNSISQNDEQQKEVKSKIEDFGLHIKKLELSKQNTVDEIIDMQAYSKDLKKADMDTKIKMRKKINDFLSSHIEHMEVCSNDYQRFVIVCFGDNIIRTYAYSDNFASDLMFNSIKVNFEGLNATQSKFLFVNYLKIIRESLKGERGAVSRLDMLNDLKQAKELYYNNLGIEL